MLTYNQERTIKEAVLGALAQDCEPIEILISDDCSSDGTFRVIEETVANYDGPHHVRINRNFNNLGLSAHIHLTQQMSSGEIIIAAAGDDVSLPNRCSRIINLFETEEPLLVHSLASIIGPNGGVAEHGYLGATFFRTTEPSKVAGSVSLYLGATAAWDKALYHKYGHLEPYAFEDLVYGFRAALEGRIGFIDEPLVQYRIGGGLSSKDMSVMQADEFREFRLAQYKAHIAVFKQRQKDASKYGLDPKDSIFKTLRTQEYRSKLRFAYWEEGARAVLRDILRHPLLVIRTIRSERRHQKKR